MTLREIIIWIQQYQFVLLFINAIFFGGVIILFLHLKFSLKKYRFLIKGNEDKDLEGLLLVLSKQLADNSNKLEELNTDFKEFKECSKKNFQNWSLVRFKAFNNVGGDQSFALALMDAYGDGLVISSIFGREESVVYCKPIKEGTSLYPLSKEEQEAITRARNGKNLSRKIIQG
jgi:hypothetical protein